MHFNILRFMLIVTITFVSKTASRSAPVHTELCKRFPTSPACVGFSPQQASFADSPIAPVNNKNPSPAFTNDINNAAFGNPNPTNPQMPNSNSNPSVNSRYPKPPNIPSPQFQPANPQPVPSSSSFPSQLPSSSFPNQSPMNNMPPQMPVPKASPMSPMGMGSGGGMPSGGMPSGGMSGPLSGLGGSPAQPQQFGGAVPGGVGMGQSFNSPMFGANSGTNVSPLSGVQSGQNYNVAGMGVGSTSGVNFGGLPGLSMIQGLGQGGGIPGLGSGMGMSSGMGMGRRRRNAAEKLFLYR